MKRIVKHCDDKYFGNRVDIYEAPDYYFCVCRERGETVFALVDKGLEGMFPISSVLNNAGFEYDFESSGDEIDLPFEFDLDKLGKQNCPAYFADLIAKAKAARCIS